MISYTITNDLPVFRVAHDGQGSKADTPNIFEWYN